MHPLPRSVLLAAALLVPAAAFTAACGESENAAAQPAPTLLQPVVDAGAPGAVALVNDGHRVKLSSAGSMRATDRFRAGSVTKPFVATVALQLVGEGQLSLSDTVEHWLPGILPYGDHVTLRQLLNHTSGIPDNQDAVDAELIKGNLTRAWTPRELVALVAGRERGTAWEYSNTNYVLAGMIIERATGHRLNRELERRVLEPLHLRHSSFPVSDAGIEGAHASGYALVDGELLDITEFNPSGMWASGNLVSTATDIARFWRALLGGRLLAPRQLAAMKTTVPAWEGTPVRYGLGIMRSPSPCGALWGHGGSIAGFANAFQNTADGRHQGAVIVNVNPGPDALSEARDEALNAAMAAAAHC